MSLLRSVLNKDGRDPMINSSHRLPLTPKTRGRVPLGPPISLLKNEFEVFRSKSSHKSYTSLLPNR